MPKRITLEVAVTTPDEAVAAVAAGADRLELCSALEVGGVTPPASTVRRTAALVPVPVMALLRQRTGGFLCSTKQELEDLSEEAVDGGGQRWARGLVFGVLSESGRIDRDRCREVIDYAGLEGYVFHRAFDFLPDPFAALEELIDLGFKRVLTSGGAPTALEGADVIARLIEQAAGRIEILPGGGITPDNVEELVRRTGCDQVHGSFRSPVIDPTLAAKPALAAGMGGGFALDPAKVAATRAVLDRLAAG